MISNWTLVVLSCVLLLFESENGKNVYDLYNFLTGPDDGKCDFFCEITTLIVVVQRIGYI